jgi:hypothetical protein
VTWHQYPNFRALAFNGALTASTHLGGSRFRLIRVVRCIGTVGGESGGAADSAEGVEVLGVRVGEDMQVFLGGGDLGVAHPVHHRLQVGAPGQQPGGVRVAQSVDADVEVDAGNLDGGPPDPVRKVFREMGVPSRVANSRSSGPRRRAAIQSASS